VSGRSTFAAVGVAPAVPVAPVEPPVVAVLLDPLSFDTDTLPSTIEADKPNGPTVRGA
jgi:hypothetical protein